MRSLLLRSLEMRELGIEGTVLITVPPRHCSQMNRAICNANKSTRLPVRGKATSYFPSVVRKLAEFAPQRRWLRVSLSTVLLVTHTMSDPLARLRAFPRAGAPNDDVSAIRGNCSMANKQLAVNVLMRVGAGESTVWGHEMIKRTKLVEMNVRPRPYTSVPSGPAGAQSLEAEVKFEVAVQQGEDLCDSDVLSALMSGLFQGC